MTGATRECRGVKVAGKDSVFRYPVLDASRVGQRMIAPQNGAHILSVRACVPFSAGWPEKDASINSKPCGKRLELGHFFAQRTPKMCVHKFEAMRKTIRIGSRFACRGRQKNVSINSKPCGKRSESVHFSRAEYGKNNACP